MEGLERIVLEHPFFAGLGPEFGAAISGCARNLRFAAGEYLFREDEPANEFYLIRHGTVALELHAPGQPVIVIATLREGDILDAAWLVPPYRWTFDARAAELVRVLGVNARCLRDKCESDHDLGYELMKRFVGAMGERLRATRLTGPRCLRDAAFMTPGHEAREVPAGWWVPQPLRVSRVRRETADVATLDLAPVSPFAFAAGQFNMLYVFGLGEVAISISGDPAKKDRIVHTVRALGAVSGALARLRRDAVVGVRGPYGSCWPVAEAEGSDVVLIAGGLGLAPLRPAIYGVLARRQSYGRVVLLYGARGPSDILTDES